MLSVRHIPISSFQSDLRHSYSKADVDGKVVNIDDNDQSLSCSYFVPCHINREGNITESTNEGGCDEWHAEDVNPLISKQTCIYTVSQWQLPYAMKVWPNLETLAGVVLLMKIILYLQNINNPSYVVVLRTQSVKQAHKNSSQQFAISISLLNRNHSIPFRESMHKKEIKLYQVSQKFCAIQSRNIKWSQNGVLVQLIKKYGAKWSTMIGSFQIPIQNIQKLLEEFTKNHDDIITKDPNINNIKTVLYESRQIDARKVTYQFYKNQGRFLVYDPLLMHRFEYTRKFLQKQTYQKVLLICFANNLSQWRSFVLQNITKQWSPVDYLILQQRNPLAKATLSDHDFYFITYELLHQLNQKRYGKVLAEKFDLIICDDSERWLNDLIDPLITKSRMTQVYTILKNFNLPKKKILLITAKLPLEPTQIYNACSILMPTQFGVKISFNDDGRANFIRSKDCNDASWMIKRYAKGNKFGRELLYLLENSVLVNLSNPNNNKFKNIIRTANSQIKIHYDPEQQILGLVDRLNQKYRKINKEEINGRIQDRRCEEAFISWQFGKTEESKYLKQLRETMVIDKMPALTKHLYHLTKELRQRVVLVLQTMATFEKLVIFLNEQTVPYVLYNINVEDIRKGNMSYTKFNVASPNAYKLCILVRDKLLMDYKRCKIEFQKQLQYEQDREAEMQLGIQQGHFSDLAMINRKKINRECFNFDKIIQYLPKINSARHLVIFDTYWYDFSEQKEDLVSSIIKAKLPCYLQANTQNNQSSSLIFTEKKIDYIRHYFVNNKSIQISSNQNRHSIIKRYNNNLNNYFGQQPQNVPSKKNQEMTLQAFTMQLFAKISKGYPKQNIKSEIHDIDDQFDQWEYELLKQKSKKEAGKMTEISQNQQEQPQYHTQTKNTPKFTVVTPMLADSDYQEIQEEEQSKIKQIQQRRDSEMQVLEQKQDDFDEIGWLKDDVLIESDNESEEGSIDLAQYLAKPRINQQISDQHIKKVKQIQEFQKKEQVNVQENDNYLDVTMRKDQKLVIDEPPECIEIDDESNKSPINIYQNYDPNSSYNNQYVNRTKFYNFPPNYNHEKPRDSKGHKIRSKPVAGLNLYGPKAQKKIIAPSTMNLAIRLIPNRSFLQVF